MGISQSLPPVGISGNILTSDGVKWSSQAMPAVVNSLNGQTGTITNTSLYAIGSYITARPNDSTNYTVNTTLSGSSLYATMPGQFRSGGAWYNSAAASLNSSVTLVNTGTWRCISPAAGDGSAAAAGVFVRIS